MNHARHGIRPPSVAPAHPAHRQACADTERGIKSLVEARETEVTIIKLFVGAEARLYLNPWAEPPYSGELTCLPTARAEDSRYINVQSKLAPDGRNY